MNKESVPSSHNLIVLAMISTFMTHSGGVIGAGTLIFSRLGAKHSNSCGKLGGLPRLQAKEQD